MPQSLKINQAGYRDIGQERKENEDFLISYHSPDRTFVYSIVADGMGGYKGGALASELAATHVSDYLKTSLALVTAENDIAVTSQLKYHLEHAIKLANKHVLEYKQIHPKLSEMGTTLVVAIIWHGYLQVANVGDSRAYLYSEQQLKLISKDHSIMQEMIDSGVLTEESARIADARNQLTQAVGITNELTINFALFPIDKPGMVLLCSDGLTEYVDQLTLEQELSRGLPASQSCHRLIEMANKQGGKDNITVVIVEYGDF